jgi:hypothetical protein
MKYFGVSFSLKEMWSHDKWLHFGTHKPESPSSTLTITSEWRSVLIPLSSCETILTITQDHAEPKFLARVAFIKIFKHLFP